MASLFSAYKVAGLVQSGRRALLRKDFEKALKYFDEAAQKDASYVRTAVHFTEGVLTYLGRTQYATGRWAEARHSLERALLMHEEDPLARLYFGMTLLRSNDVASGVRELRAGLERLAESMENVANRRAFENYWDPTGQIWAEVKSALDMCRSKEVDYAILLASAEWIGHEVEEETDRARRDESRDRQRE